MTFTPDTIALIIASLALAVIGSIVILLLIGIRSDRKERDRKMAENHDMPAGYIFETCPWCQEKVWGTASDIDSGLRKHMEYCESAPDDEEIDANYRTITPGEAQPMIPVSLSPDEIELLRSWFGPDAENRAGESIWSLAIAYDPIDRAIKFKINGYSWSPPMGETDIHSL